MNDNFGVLYSIKPEYCELIASGKKTVDVRKTIPKKLKPPFKCYIYCTKAKKPVRWENDIAYYKDDLAITDRFGRGKLVENPYGSLSECEELLNGKVIGEFICDEIIEAKCGEYCLLPPQKTQVDAVDLCNYADGKTIYGLNISNLVIYDEPKELSDFYLYCDKFGTEKCNSTCSRFFYDEIWDGYDEYVFTDCNAELYRPPQSWCYVACKCGVM